MLHYKSIKTHTTYCCQRHRTHHRPVVERTIHCKSFSNWKHIACYSHANAVINQRSDRDVILARRRDECGHWVIQMNDRNYRLDFGQIQIFFPKTNTPVDWRWEKFHFGFVHFWNDRVHICCCFCCLFFLIFSSAKCIFAVANNEIGIWKGRSWIMGKSFYVNRLQWHRGRAELRHTQESTSSTINLELFALWLLYREQW